MAHVRWLLRCNMVSSGMDASARSKAAMKHRTTIIELGEGTSRPARAGCRRCARAAGVVRDMGSRRTPARWTRCNKPRTLPICTSGTPRCPSHRSVSPTCVTARGAAVDVGEGRDGRTSRVLPIGATEGARAHVWGLSSGRGPPSDWTGFACRPARALTRRQCRGPRDQGRAEAGAGVALCGPKRRRK